jgi:hypothetical protein
MTTKWKVISGFLVMVLLLGALAVMGKAANRLNTSAAASRVDKILLDFVFMDCFLLCFG